jgi:ribose/xylose/arabinose/galactoside ABC-type transport system permease subunit
MSTYLILDFIHVLLFAYWLGPDWGVFVCGRRVADPALSREERMRFLRASVAIDVAPRSAIVLIIAVGLTLATLGGYISLSAPMLALVWLVAVIWLLLVWFTGYILEPGPLKTRLDTMHVVVRHVVTVVLLGVGLYSLAFGQPVVMRWLAVKLILVAILIAQGSALRVIVSKWVRDLTGVPGFEGAIARTYPFTRKLAMSFWFVSASIAFLGVTKLF